ncbi:MAG: hypothetical protein AABW49_03170 [Nanoarchaeota archaeon]
MKFSDREKKDLFKGWIAISIAFGIVLSDNITDVQFFQNVIIAAITVGVAFILHELAHKYFAQKYHCWAEFRSFDFMLILAIIMSFFGFIFAAPGAVMINGHIKKRQSGIISAAGPCTNILLSLLFLPGFILVKGEGVLHDLFYYGFVVNAMLAVFNLLPFAIFDGKKVYEWDKKIWGLLIVVSFVLLVIGWF